MAKNMAGLLRIKVLKGINLVVKDTTSESDPFVIISMGSQKVKTKHIKDNSNPEWNEDLSLAIYDVDVPINLAVYDKDPLSTADELGEAQIDIKPYLECLKTSYDDLPDNTVVDKVLPNRENCLADPSRIVWKDGKLLQHMLLRLKNVASGEVEIQLEWVNISGSLKL